MIIHFVSENNSENKLLEEFNKPKSRRSLNENFPLILFLFKDIDRNNKDYIHFFFDYTYIKWINLKNIYSEIIKEKDNKASKEDLIATYLKIILYNEYDSYFTERGHKIVDEIDPLSNTPKLRIYLPIILVGSPELEKVLLLMLLMRVEFQEPLLHNYLSLLNLPTMMLKFQEILMKK